MPSKQKPQLQHPVGQEQQQQAEDQLQLEGSNLDAQGSSPNKKRQRDEQEQGDDQQEEDELREFQQQDENLLDLSQLSFNPLRQMIITLSMVLMFLLWFIPFKNLSRGTSTSYLWKVIFIMLCELAASSILILKPGRHHDDMVKIFGEQRLEETVDNLNKVFGVKKAPLPHNSAVGEAKASSQGDNYYVLCKDLLQMKAVLGIQVVGRSVTFYLISLLSDGFYVMLELLRVVIPGCLDDLLKYLMDMNKILMVLEVFEKWCKTVPVENVSQLDQRTRTTLSTPTFCRIISQGTSRKRSCVLKYYYN
ncbi:hypothetical protein EC973_004462 [Apophysomyces ossiformis]|uniref:Uncharacterized protein n=1 Tax=Apophysomyces ossiformis TaxID=679940 RepID=A0A8H7EPX1_9FUNG|nr:hypothetical protein EC973_004462 [Apophysomyces ossiformis]